MKLYLHFITTVFQLQRTTRLLFVQAVLIQLTVGFVLLHPELVEVGVRVAHQVLVVAFLDHTAVLEDEYAVGVHHRAQSMCHTDRRSSLRCTI